MTLVIRLATAADIPRMQEIETSAAVLFNGWGLIDMDDMSVVAISDHLDAIEAKLSLVAVMGGRTAGFVMGEMQGDEAYLHELDVDAAFQRQGIGAGLVRAFAEAARAKGATAVTLSTFRDPPWNAPFYGRMGFGEIARSAYLPWMISMEEQQSAFLDVSRRLFMRMALA